MILNTKIETKVKLERIHVLRAIHDDGFSKKVIAEKEFSTVPYSSEIANFLNETRADFVSLVTNFRLPIQEVPFE